MNPMIPDSRFSSNFLGLNHLDKNYAGWQFLPGMDFVSAAA